MKKIRLGVPRSLLYYKYHILWITFFKYLDAEIIESPNTNKEILNKGITLAADETCLPLKLYLGHVDSIKDKIDYLLVPRMVSIKKNEHLCDKFTAVCDIIRNTYEDIKAIEFTVDVNNKKLQYVGFFKAGLKFSKNPLKIIKAYKRALAAQEEYKKELEKEQEEKLKNKSDKLSVLIASHPYNIFDELLGKPIIKYLESHDVEIFYTDLIETEVAYKLSKEISQDLYWTYNKEIVGGMQYFKDKVDGIISIVTFPCGPDSLANEVCQRRIKNIPIMTLVIDELQGEAGLKTRLESFVDIIKMQKNNEKKKNSIPKVG